MNAAKRIENLSYYSDTPLEIENLQVDLLRKAGAAERFKITLAMSQRMISLSKQALKRRNTGLSELDIKILFVKNCYGPGTAEKVKKYMLERDPHGTA
ncbi:MAG: hypothetical protein KAW12_05770 [Candidatus Aminicenantes bacterium]|nr:hypothetical protein [Candidatus Aminicenantes bacterium]